MILMEIIFLPKGFLIGLSIAAPVGPIGVLCIRRTLSDGRIYGFVAGLGAATADAVYGSIAGFGITFISSFLVSYQAALTLLGGIFLCYLGYGTFKSTPSEKPAEAGGELLAAVYSSTFFLTLTNPMTILSFTAVFAGLGIGGTVGDYMAASLLVAGVFLGSVAWWFTLSGIVSVFRERFTDRGLKWVNRIAGLIIISFGAIALGGILAGKL